MRRDPAGRWHELAPATRAELSTRVVVVGAASTGTTTLAEALAAHYAARGGVWTYTLCVPEYGREYTHHRERRIQASTSMSWSGMRTIST